MNIDDDLDFKNCPECGEKVRFTSKKCPHCMSWQGRKYSLSNPILAGFLPMLLFLLTIPFLFRVFTSTIDKPANRFADYRARIVVLSPEMNYAEQDGKRMISTIGRIRNDSPITWVGVAIEVQYLNRNGELIDTANDSPVGLTLEPHTETAFRIRTEADQPRSEYVSQVVILHDASDAHRY